MSDNNTPDPTPALLSAAPTCSATDMARAIEFAQRLTASGACDDGTLMSRSLLASRAHLDALTGPVPDDGGEALGREHYLRLHGAELCASVWPTLPAEVRARFVAAAIALYQRGRAAGRSEGEAIGRAQRETAIEIRDATIDGQAAEIARLTEELAIVADRMKRAEGAQAQLDRALASCETYRAEIERLTAERDTAHDEYIEATERADIAVARVGNLAAELVEARATLRTETTIKEQVQDELVAMRLKRREEWERAERLTAELAEVRRVINGALDASHDAIIAQEQALAAARRDGAREERRLCLQDIEDEVETNHYATGEARALRAAQRRIRARGEGGGR